MALPEGFLEDLKFRNPIEDVISSYVSLKRAGSNLVGLCPFHNEKSPSFTVFPATRGFYCFGCGAGGDAITFVMKAENLDYIGAVEHLCKRAGIEMPQDDYSKRHGEDDVKKARVFAANRDAARFHHANVRLDRRYLSGGGWSCLFRRNRPLAGRSDGGSFFARGRLCRRRRRPVDQLHRHRRSGREMRHDGERRGRGLPVSGCGPDVDAGHRRA